MDTDVNFICKIDRELYRVVDQDLVTDDVIITEQQILHIEDPRLPRGGHLIEQVLHPQGTAKWAFKLPTPLPVSNGGSAN